MAEQIQFTPDRLAAIEPSQKPVTFHDSKVPGLIVVVTPAGSKTFYLYRRIQGKPKRVRIGKFPELKVRQAREQANRINSEVEAGTFTARPRTALYGMIHGLYIADAKNRIRSWKASDDLNRNHLKDWNSIPIADVTFELVAGKHAKVGEKSPAVANRILSSVSCVFKFAAQNGHIPRTAENPAQGISKFPEKARKRFLSPDELQRWFAAVDRMPSRTFADFFLMLLYTGHRSGKVKSMRWSDITLSQRIWRIETNKNGEEITVHLPEPAIEILERRDQSSEWVFPAPNRKTGHIKVSCHAWGALLEDADISDFRMHDLRHTMASWQAINGASLTVIGSSLGHRSHASTARYAHVSLDAVRESVDSATAKMVAVRDGNSSAADPVNSSTTEPLEKLSKLKQLLEADLITQADYDEAKSKVIDSL